MRRKIGHLGFLAVLLIAMPAVWVSAHHPERAIDSVNPKPVELGPEHIDRMVRIDLKHDMAADIPEVEVPFADREGAAPERVDVIFEPSLAPIPPLYMTDNWTRDESYNIRDSFRPGEKVYWVVGIQNDTGASASVTGIWDIDYPDGSSVFYSNPTWSVPAGYSQWQYNSTVDSTGGMYTFFASIDYLDHHSEGTAYYRVLTIHSYLPIVQRQ